MATSVTCHRRSSKPRSTLRNGPTNPWSKSNSRSLHRTQGASDTSRAAVAAHIDPRPLQDVSAIELVRKRVEPSPGISLGRPVKRMLQGTNRVITDPEAAELAETAAHRAPPRRARHIDEAAALPSPAVVLSVRLQQYYGRLRRPPDPTPTSRRRPVIRRVSPVTTSQFTGSGRASPVPAVTICMFHTPYAGGSLAAANSGSSPRPWPSP